MATPFSLVFPRRPPQFLCSSPLCLFVLSILTLEPEFLQSDIFDIGVCHCKCLSGLHLRNMFRPPPPNVVIGSVWQIFYAFVQVHYVSVVFVYSAITRTGRLSQEAIVLLAQMLLPDRPIKAFAPPSV